MKAIVGFLSIKREEHLPVGLFFVWQLLLQTLAITKYVPLFTNPSSNYYKLFVDNYHLSGFDPLTYLVVSDWSLAFDVNRHPLLALFYYPFSLLNKLLICITGTNFAIYIVACVLLFFCSRFTFKYSSRPFHFVDVYAFAHVVYCRKMYERTERNGHLANCSIVFAYCRHISE